MINLSPFITGQGTSLWKIAENQTKGLDWRGEKIQPWYTPEFFKLKSDFAGKYFSGGNATYGLNFDPYKVPDDELFNYLNAYKTNVSMTGKSGIMGITAANSFYGLQNAIAAGDSAKVRAALMKGSQYQLKNHGPSGSFLGKIAPLLLGAAGFATGIPALSIAGKVAGGINTMSSMQNNAARPGTGNPAGLNISAAINRPVNSLTGTNSQPTILGGGRGISLGEAAARHDKRIYR